MSNRKHQPFHLYIDDQIYFFTVHTYRDLGVLDSIKRKSKLKQKLKDIALQKKGKIIAWVILDNHYHLLMRSGKGKDIPDVFRLIHGSTSFEWNKEDDARGRKVWQNYWDRCIKNEKDYWTHVNYIHHNPVKHRYVERMEDYEFSSFNYYVNKDGKEWVMSAFERYPVIDYTIDGDGG
ncbi:MAG: REP-associated tyrosine transposase [Candidatus Anammoxibacter sp.]